MKNWIAAALLLCPFTALAAEPSAGTVGNEMNPSISLILDAVGAYFSNERGFRQGGHAPTRSGPSLQGAELAMSASVDPWFRVDAAFEMSHLHLEEIFLTTTSLPFSLQLRAGQFKSHAGRLNATHPHQWHFVTQPLANEFIFGAEGITLPGAEISWLAPLPWYLEIKGSLQTGSAGVFRTRSIADGDPGFRDFLYPLRLVQFFDISDDWALQVGASGVFGPSDQGPESGNRAQAFGVDLFLKWRPIGAGTTGHTFVAWTAETWVRQMEVPDDLWTDLGATGDVVFGISKRWETALRLELWRRLAGAMSETRARYGLNAFRVAANVGFLPSHFSRIRLQYQIENIETYNSGHVLMLQVEVSAGAHGAHAY